MFSASSEARDRNAPTNANQIRLQTSRIRQEHRPIRYQLPARLSFRQGQDVWADAQAQGSDDLDHERDITLASHAAIPDLIRHTDRHVKGWQRLPRGLSETVRVELSGEAGSAGNNTTTITAVRRRYKSKGPFDDR
jgi:hypothetical protein